MTICLRYDSALCIDNPAKSHHRSICTPFKKKTSMECKKKQQTHKQTKNTKIVNYYTQTTAQLKRGLIPTKDWNLSWPIFVAFFQWASQEWYCYVWYSSIPPKNIQYTHAKFQKAWCTSYLKIVLNWAESVRCTSGLYTIYQKVLADPKYYYHHFHFQTFNYATGTRF